MPRDASTYASLYGEGAQAVAARQALCALERRGAAALQDPAAAPPRPPQFQRSKGVLHTCQAVDMDAEWAALWQAGTAELAAALAALPGDASALAYLHARLGYDAGCIVKGLHDAGLSWGTYQDAMCNKAYADWHCNAHSNNLMVVAEGAVAAGAQGSTRLLAMLDIDVRGAPPPLPRTRAHGTHAHP